MKNQIKRSFTLVCLLLTILSSVTALAQDYSVDGSKANTTGGISFYGGNETDDPKPSTKPSNIGSNGEFPKTGELLEKNGKYIILILSLFLVLYIYKYKKIKRRKL